VEAVLAELEAALGHSFVRTELLVRASMCSPSFEGTIRQAYAAICAQAEEAVSQTIGGNPTEAVLQLLASADLSLNAKLIDLALHTIERFRRTNFGHLHLDVTIDDQNVFTKPWAFGADFKLQADTELIESICENERDVAHMPARK